MDEQRTDEWYAARLGKVTASRVADVMAKTKSGYSTSRANYMAQLVAERLTGTKTDGFVNAAMQWGIDHEDQAVTAYEFFRDETAETVGFVDHPDIAMSGASPDRLIGTAGLVEIKCPITATHIATLRSGKGDSKYVKQMQWQMDCTERDWCDFVSFDPRMPAAMQMFVTRIERDQKLIEDIRAEVTGFLSELDALVGELQSKYGQQEAA